MKCRHCFYDYKPCDHLSFVFFYDHDKSLARIYQDAFIPRWLRQGFKLLVQ